MALKLVSILMPAYNCEKFINQAIDSILNQTYPNFELLIADDGSKDSTKQIIDSYTDERIKRFHNEENLGYLKASNKLFKQCTGQLITFQDADDYSDLTRIEKLVEFLDKNNEVSVIGSNVIKVDENGVCRPQTNFPEAHEAIVKGFENYKIVFTGSALMLRKAVMEKFGIYNEYFDRIGSEDTYWFSAIIGEMKVASLSEPLYYYRINSGSVTATHKNPKAFVGHDLIIHLYNRRKKGKNDYIASGEWETADTCGRFIMALKIISQSRSRAFFRFTKELIFHPVIGMQFTREFFAKIKTV
jgi:glycosyltransferase involved in cell wall biosynthesis